MTDKEIHQIMTEKIAIGTHDGVVIALRLWVTANKIDISPSPHSKAPLSDALDIILSDFAQRDLEYPYSESIRGEVEKVMNEYAAFLKILQLGENWDEMQKLTAHIVSGQVIEFFHKHSGQTVQLIKKVQELPAGGPHG